VISIAGKNPSIAARRLQGGHAQAFEVALRERADLVLDEGDAGDHVDLDCRAVLAQVRDEAGQMPKLIECCRNCQSLVVGSNYHRTL